MDKDPQKDRIYTDWQRDMTLEILKFESIRLYSRFNFRN